MEVKNKQLKAVNVFLKYEKILTIECFFRMRFFIVKEQTEKNSSTYSNSSLLYLMSKYERIGQPVDWTIFTVVSFYISSVILSPYIS